MSTETLPSFIDLCLIDIKNVCTGSRKLSEYEISTLERIKENKELVRQHEDICQ